MSIYVHIYLCFYFSGEYRLIQWIIDLNFKAKVIKVETIILLEENIDKYISDVEWANIY